MKDIKIYISCHDRFFVPEHPMLIPLQVGAELRGELFEGMCHDNEGENISDQNRFYSELTGQYWAWKNQQADYYGFFHYRRYLVFDGGKAAYRLADRPDNVFLHQNGLDAEQLQELIPQYDMIVPKALEMYETVLAHYKNDKLHGDEELEKVFGIMYELYPHMKEAGQRYLNSTRMYFCNMYIMRKDIFFDYCQWLFHILGEYDRRLNGERIHRIEGYLSERLFGAYYLWMQENRQVRCLEAARVDFEFNGGGLTGKRLLQTLFPQGTKRRALLKRVIRI